MKEIAQESLFLADTTRPHNAAVTKAVYGVCVDPHVEHRIASFSEVTRLEQSQLTDTLLH